MASFLCQPGSILPDRCIQAPVKMKRFERIRLMQIRSAYGRNPARIATQGGFMMQSRMMVTADRAVVTYSCALQVAPFSSSHRCFRIPIFCGLAFRFCRCHDQIKESLTAGRKRAASRPDHVQWTFDSQISHRNDGKLAPA